MIATDDDVDDDVDADDPPPLLTLSRLT